MGAEQYIKHTSCYNLLQLKISDHFDAGHRVRVLAHVKYVKIFFEILSTATRALIYSPANGAGGYGESLAVYEMGLGTSSERAAAASSSLIRRVPQAALARSPRYPLLSPRRFLSSSHGFPAERGIAEYLTVIP